MDVSNLKFMFRHIHPKGSVEPEHTHPHRFITLREGVFHDDGGENRNGKRP